MKIKAYNTYNELKEGKEMTNQNAAIIRNMERLSYTIDEYKRAIISSGMTIVKEETAYNGMEIIEATKETSRGTLSIYCVVNGTVHINKPNGARRWVHKKTPNQISALIRQTIEYYE